MSNHNFSHYPYPKDWLDSSNKDFLNKKDAIIQGQMITAQHVLDSSYYITCDTCDAQNLESEIKKVLMTQLVEYMYSNKFILFTKHQDINTNKHKYYARIYVVPDDQVRILRDYKK